MGESVLWGSRCPCDRCTLMYFRTGTGAPPGPGEGRRGGWGRAPGTRPGPLGSSPGGVPPARKRTTARTWGPPAHPASPYTLGQPFAAANLGADTLPLSLDVFSRVRPHKLAHPPCKNNMWIPYVQRLRRRRRHFQKFPVTSTATVATKRECRAFRPRSVSGACAAFLRIPRFPLCFRPGDGGGRWRHLGGVARGPSN